jgi:hypothetical protein
LCSVISQVWNILDVFCAIGLDIYVSLESKIMFTVILLHIYQVGFLALTAVTLLSGGM